MKKLIALIAVLCLVFTGSIWLYQSKQTPADTYTPTDTIELPPPASAQSLDYDAIYALHAPEEVIATCGDKDITWQEYYRHLTMNAAQLESSFISIRMSYGVDIGWDSTVSNDSDDTFADYLIELTESSLLQGLAIDAISVKESLGIENDITALADEELKSFISENFPEGGEKELSEKLEQNGLSLDSFKLMILLSVKNSECFSRLYGENAANVSDEDAMSYLESNDYVYANHILLMTMNPNTGESATEDEALAKKAKAEELYAELAAIDDPEQLLTRFWQLKQEHCEDSGKTAYPDGYTFKPGTMVASFDETARALKDYEVSEPVESSYGYHIIMRVPLSVYAPISIDEQGNIQNAKTLYATEDFAKRLEEQSSSTPISYKPDFTPVNVADYLA